ncbi:MAG: V-type ATP synthase subunit F [Actinobacteria bacterium]|jgi:V/A-type H+-transporting ATPase subunit F|nr:MAG: V-type ATP synthase subunit F [Actinomycetota bacterium]
MGKLKLAMIGGFTSVAGFKAVGVDSYPVASPQEGPVVWNALPLEKYAVVMITEPVYEVLLEQVPDFPAIEDLPVVITVPAVSGSSGLGKAGVRKRVEKALGSVIEG